MKKTVHEVGTVASGYFEYPDGEWTWIAPDWQEYCPPFERRCVEREIDRRIRLQAMGC